MHDRVEERARGADHRGRDDRRGARQERHDGSRPRGHANATSWTSPSTMRHARTLSAPLAGSDLGIAQRDEDVQRIRVEGLADIGR